MVNKENQQPRKSSQDARTATLIGHSASQGSVQAQPPESTPWLSSPAAMAALARAGLAPKDGPLKEAVLAAKPD